MRALRCLLQVVVLGLLPAAAGADPVRPEAGGVPSPFMRVYSSAYPPYGFVQFCRRSPEECVAGLLTESRIAATPARLSELDEINRAVNRAIAPATDLDLYGVQEYWTLPADRGDCEDYAILKRHLLIARGWPAGALLLTVVRDEIGEGHAVLTVRTTQGDFVLDNKRPEIRIWHKTGYQFVMRQSYVDPKAWLSLEPNDAYGPAPLTGMPREE
ncbi:MAG TPA: transglutaminase-like cysteine peptidase [Hyphomicrobiaceae bacterium]|nr:transglutaminase-like cysteine peptidase [Hyphomicrobiaceae bacterium]